ncbi:prolyl aminopeptidase [Catenovulum sediminis]|uniref:prolyl aminopeptidase n=1 Tax=Catenovulum sediminis TaxID=1740262 RepID=UPI00117FEE9F|nr:prolyl aminopeptidase [Catenovulum sediminis]
MLYPDIKQNHTHWLPTEDGHTLYVEESGNPKGYPVIYCHGGPGGASTPMFRRLFDPEVYRIIIFDQRGCGYSEPFLSLHNNQTDKLIDDIELIRTRLHLKKFLLSGGSWGTTLALLYAQSYPQHVSALLLRGIFLGRQKDLAWLYEPNGAARLFPDYYRQFCQHINPELNKKLCHQQIIEQYYELLTSNNEIRKLAAARAWCLWESQIAYLHFTNELEAKSCEAHHALAMALMECHYFRNHCFIEENQILNNIERIQHIPATIIHGRYDAVCDLNQAWELSEIWQNSRLLIVPNAGHSLGEPLIADAFCQAARSMARYLLEQEDKTLK